MGNDNSSDDNVKRRKGIFTSVPRALLWAAWMIILFALFTLVAPLVLTDQPYAVTWEELMKEGRDLRMLQMIGVTAVVVLIALIVSTVRKALRRSGSAWPN